MAGRIGEPLDDLVVVVPGILGSRLVRTDVGPIRLGSLKPGTSRNLTTREVGELYAAVGL